MKHTEGFLKITDDAKSRAPAFMRSSVCATSTSCTRLFASSVIFRNPSVCFILFHDPARLIQELSGRRANVRAVGPPRLTFVFRLCYIIPLPKNPVESAVRPKTALLLPTLIACALAVAGCHYTRVGDSNTGATAGGIGPGAPPADVDSVIARLNSFTDELMKSVEQATDTNAGVASAQTLLDSRKGELTESIAALKRDARFQQDAAAKSKWNEAEADGTVPLLFAAA